MVGPILVSSVGGARGSEAAAAALACAAAGPDRAALLVDVGGRRPRPGLFATMPARDLEERISRHDPDLSVAAKGTLCCAAASDPEAAGRAAAAASIAGARAVVHLRPELLAPALELAPGPAGVLLRAVPRDQRSMLALAVAGLWRRGIAVRVLKAPLGWLVARRASAGALPRSAPGALPERLVRSLLGEAGQVLPLALGGALALVATALVLVAIAGAVTGKGRAQRAADLAAISAARSMRDDLPRLLSPPRLPNGLPNPLHLEKAAYLARARAAGMRAGLANGVTARRMRIAFPDRVSFAPLLARAEVVGTLPTPGAAVRVQASATAEAAGIHASGSRPERQAQGGGYEGPLATRQGEGMRPDVAVAFDHLAAAARQAGLALVISSAFRSDAEQAALFAANPDPRWVAPPGRSLHRCATELDLGPAAAYGWLAANAGRFGFVQRYSWEPWHFGYASGPAPCSDAGDAVAAGDGTLAGRGGLPRFVPARFRAPLLRAASRWNVSAALLAAQLMAESNFNPYAVSSAGAQGIAQFIPSTAAAYGLRDPFDAAAAIDAQAHLMSDLLRRFGAPALALSAYNAGPGAVAACDCVPPYAETRAYVARILALLGGAGPLPVPSFEARLVD